MTVVGVGVDAVSVSRWLKVTTRTPSLETFVFTDVERALAQSQGALAARFAAKEACRKAFKAYIPWKEMEVLDDPSGCPTLTVRGRPGFRMHVSLTRGGDVAFAVVIVEKSAGDSAE